MNDGRDKLPPLGDVVLRDQLQALLHDFSTLATLAQSRSSVHSTAESRIVSLVVHVFGVCFLY